MIDYRRARGRGGRRRAGRRRPGAPGPERAVIDSREVAPGRPVRRPAGASAPTAGEFAADALCRPAPGGCWSRPSTPSARGGGTAARACGARVIAVDDPLAALQRAGAGLAPRAGRQGDRRHRLDRQDLDQGHPCRAARRAHGAPTPAARTSNTEIGLPLTILEAPPRHRGAGARDGHARRGADRRAGGDRRARRRRDRQRRARCTWSCWAPSSGWPRPRRS